MSKSKEGMLCESKRNATQQQQQQQQTLRARRLVSRAFHPEVSSTATLSAPVITSVMVSSAREKFFPIAPNSLSRKKIYTARPVQSSAPLPLKSCGSPCLEPPRMSSPALVSAPSVPATRDRTLGSECSRCWSQRARRVRRKEALVLWLSLSTMLCVP